MRCRKTRHEDAILCHSSCRDIQLPLACVVLVFPSSWQTHRMIHQTTSFLCNVGTYKTYFESVRGHDVSWRLTDRNRVISWPAARASTFLSIPYPCSVRPPHSHIQPVLQR